VTITRGIPFLTEVPTKEECERSSPKGLGVQFTILLFNVLRSLVVLKRGGIGPERWFRLGMGFAYRSHNYYDYCKYPPL
jgi:hypothetical protein